LGLLRVALAQRLDRGLGPLRALAQGLQVGLLAGLGQALDPALAHGARLADVEVRPQRRGLVLHEGALEIRLRGVELQALPLALLHQRREARPKRLYGPAPALELGLLGAQLPLGFRRLALEPPQLAQARPPLLQGDEALLVEGAVVGPPGQG